MASLSPTNNFFSMLSHSPDPSTKDLNPIEKDDEILRETIDRGRTAIASDRRFKSFWNDLEDKKLTELVQKHGNHWRLISKEMISRRGKQCRERWVNHLHPDIAKGPAIEIEGNIIFQQYKLVPGNWINIAQKVNKYRNSNLNLKTRRTSEWCKNLWNSRNRLNERVSKRNHDVFFANDFTTEFAVGTPVALKTLPKFNRKMKRDDFDVAPTSKAHKASDHYVPKTAHQSPPLVPHESSNQHLPLEDDYLGTQYGSNGTASLTALMNLQQQFSFLSNLLPITKH